MLVEKWRFALWVTQVVDAIWARLVTSCTPLQAAPQEAEVRPR